MKISTPWSLPPDLPSPVYLLDRQKILRNGQILRDIADQSGATILMALKAFAQTHAFPVLKPFLSGTTASSIHEARLGAEEFGGETHAYAPAYSCEDVRLLSRWADHLVFNSWRQFRELSPVYREEASRIGREVSVGLRINPGYSEVEVPLYDPCRKGSRLGIPVGEVAGADWQGVDGLHFHTMCEQDSDVLERTVEVVEKSLGSRIGELKWMNFGGGHHITREDYDRQRLVRIVGDFRKRHGVQVYLEPGEAVALNAGYLVATVLDVVENGGPVAILDTSATAHMPDVLEMPYRPRIIGAGDPEEKPHKITLGGLTCLAGDEIGTYSFDEPLEPGDRLVFEDMAIYTMVKNTTFNGVQLPAIAMWDSESGELLACREFGYEAYRSRLS